MSEQIADYLRHAEQVERFWASERGRLIADYWLAPAGTRVYPHRSQFTQEADND